MSTPFRPDEAATAPFVKPYCQMVDPLLQQPISPDQLTDRARGLLIERYGPSEQSMEAAFAHGAVGLISGHTHYFDGFALLLSFQEGTAVAVRETPTPRSVLTLEGSDDQWIFGGSSSDTEDDSQRWPAWACVVKEIVRQVGPAGVQVEVGVVSTVRAGCPEAYLAALGVAAARAVQALFALHDSTATLLEKTARIIAACVGLPFSIAYLIAAEAGRPAYLTLVDTATGEQLPIEAPTIEQFGWGLIDIGDGHWAKASVDWERKGKAEKALDVLKKNGFDHITSFRDLEHRDLHRALEVLPRRLKPIVRHLVTENRRVQRMVLATNKKDWQMFGALLLMSHASLRDDWGGTSDEVDFVVEQVEAMSLDGMYGASVSGRGGCVLVAGQSFVVPRGLDRIKANFEARFGRAPDVMLL